MIKTKVIETPKGRLLVVGGLPENAKISLPKNVTFDGYNGTLVYKDKNSNPVFIGLPQGNWQLLGKLLDMKEGDAEKIIPESFYEHLNKKRGLWYAALLYQWIESKVPLRNPLGSFDEFDMLVYNHSKERLEEWKAEESKIFHNVVLFWEQNS